MDQISIQGARLAFLVDRHVGERIRSRRTLLGFTQEQLAEALDISYQQIQKYETGANRVSAGRLFQIAQKLGVDGGYFFDGLNGLGDGGPSMPHGGVNRIVIELVRNFNEIDDPVVRQSVANLVKSLASSSSTNLTAFKSGLGSVDDNSDLDKTRAPKTQVGE